MAGEYDGRHSPPDLGTGGQQLWAGVIVFAISVVALLYLQERGHDTTTLMVLVGPVVAAFFVSGHVSRLTAKQNQKLEEQHHTLRQITEQTNGMLDDRIRNQVIHALRAAGVADPDPPRRRP